MLQPQPGPRRRREDEEDKDVTMMMVIFFHLDGESGKKVEYQRFVSDGRRFTITMLGLMPGFVRILKRLGAPPRQGPRKRGRKESYLGQEKRGEEEKKEEEEENRNPKIVLRKKNINPKIVLREKREEVEEEL